MKNQGNEIIRNERRQQEISERLKPSHTKKTLIEGREFGFNY